ncbi:MAG: RadC family protein [Clostridia bacterium]|nr:RadC family protein [Clostridia bacterium]
MSIHEEHRKRLDRKVRERGLEMLEEHEQLEYILYAVIPRRDTNKLAHELLERFVTIAGVLNAEVDELMEFEGMGRRSAEFLVSLPDLLGIVERSMTVSAPPKLDNIEEIGNFAKTYFHGKLTETAYLLCLNSTFRLRSVIKISDGAQHEAYMNPPMVVRKALKDNASAVVVIHNHPCGDPKPSVADVTVSRELARAFEAVDIIFADSVIISGDEFFSFREYGYLMDLEKKF